jgi:DNA polymerase III epsilon subunit-like protein
VKNLKKEFDEQLAINTSEYIQHNALDDAELLRETYLAIKKLV